MMGPEPRITRRAGNIALRTTDNLMRRAMEASREIFEAETEVADV